MENDSSYHKSLRSSQPHGDATQDFPIVDVRIVKSGSVNDNYTTIWIIGMNQGKVLDVRGVRLEFVADRRDFLANQNVDELEEQ